MNTTLNGMIEKDYLTDRLDDQIRWYSSKSSKCKKWFLIMRTFEITIAAIIPVLFYLPVKSSIPFLSAIIIILVSLISLFKFHENWLLYRTTSESLKHEKYLYLTNTKPYNRENKLVILVQNVEEIISSENSLWKQKTLSNNNEGGLSR